MLRLSAPWSDCKKVSFIILVSIGLWAVIFYATRLVLGDD